jgi:hypothetical protein
MLEIFREVPDADYISFLPHDDNEDAVEILSQYYKDELKGEPIGGTSVGPAYHVILFQIDKESDEVVREDSFEAIFADVREYISGLIPQDWYGVVIKKTTKSGPIFQDMVARMTEQ